jgi:hypothetical protein
MDADWHLSIDTSELRKACNVLLDHLETQVNDEAQLKVDYFWSVSPENIFDVSSSPELTIGQLSESWGNLARERQGDGSMSVAYGLVWLSEVLLALGQSNKY